MTLLLLLLFFVNSLYEKRVYCEKAGILSKLYEQVLQIKKDSGINYYIMEFKQKIS